MGYPAVSYLGGPYSNRLPCPTQIDLSASQSVSLSVCQLVRHRVSVTRSRGRFIFLIDI